jgi:uncharacterized protein YndB with AHSA1/START domain
MPSAIRRWWGVARAIVLPQPGGVWAAAWGEVEDDPDYITAATIQEFEPPHRMILRDYRYRAKGGPLPFVAEFVTQFIVLPHPKGAVLQVTQDGFPVGPEADELCEPWVSKSMLTGMTVWVSISFEQTSLNAKSHRMYLARGKWSIH